MIFSLPLSSWTVEKSNPSYARDFANAAQQRPVLSFVQWCIGNCSHLGLLYKHCISLHPWYDTINAQSIKQSIELKICWTKRFHSPESISTYCVTGAKIVKANFKVSGLRDNKKKGAEQE